MLNDMQKNLMARAIEIRMNRGEDAIEIINTYKNLTQEDKKELLEYFNVAWTASIDDAKAEKITELSLACQKAIIDGVTILIDGVAEHFSYGIESGDQSNIDSLFSLATATGLPQPYHCDGGDCKLYTPEQIQELYITATSNKMMQTTYFNQLKHMIESEYVNDSDVETVKAIEYGTPLTGKYLDNYNQMMAHSATIIARLTNAEV